MVFDVNPVVRLQGVVYRLTGKTPSQSIEQAEAEKCKAASRGELLEAPFQQNRASRFSTASEQCLFYGSRSREGCLIEVAYYALFFYINSEYSESRLSTLLSCVLSRFFKRSGWARWSCPVFPSCEKTMKISKILFQVEIDSENCLKLQEQGNDELQAKLRDPVNYSFSQAVGAQMRAAEITCFEYFSARSSGSTVQFGAFTPDVFCSPPSDPVNVTIKVSQAAVEILCHDDNRTCTFTRQQYEINGQLPSPACVEREEKSGLGQPV